MIVPFSTQFFLGTMHGREREVDNNEELHIDTFEFLYGTIHRL